MNALVPLSQFGLLEDNMPLDNRIVLAKHELAGDAGGVLAVGVEIARVGCRLQLHQDRLQLLLYMCGYVLSSVGRC